MDAGVLARSTTPFHPRTCRVFSSTSSCVVCYPRCSVNPEKAVPSASGSISTSSMASAENISSSRVVAVEETMYSTDSPVPACVVASPCAASCLAPSTTVAVALVANRLNFFYGFDVALNPGRFCNEQVVVGGLQRGAPLSDLSSAGSPEPSAPSLTDGTAKLRYRAFDILRLDPVLSRGCPRRRTRRTSRFPRRPLRRPQPCASWLVISSAVRCRFLVVRAFLSSFCSLPSLALAVCWY